MDAKALAKSKRAHSQQLSKKHHPNPKSKTQSGSGSVAQSSSGTTKDSSGKKVREKAIRGLPSNWDRYDEGNDSKAEDSSSGSAANQETSDSVLPKSKGADYRHLIAEAQSQSESTIYSDSFPSFDDILPGEFSQAFCSMLSVRGESILSRLGDDNFVVEDKTTAINEASFLSLNLHALAEQLEKIDLSKRLFIEPDLLPPQLKHPGGSNACSNQESDQLLSNHDKIAFGRPCEEILFSDFSKKVSVGAQTNKVTSSASPGSDPPERSIPILGSIPVYQLNIDLGQPGESDQHSILTEATEPSSANSFTEPNRNISNIKVAAAEAELDMLFDSLNETMVHDSSCLRSPRSQSIQKDTFVAPMQHRIKIQDSLASMTPNLDDALDELLKDTSRLVNRNSLSESQVEKTNHFSQSSSTHSETKSTALDDFDSWLDTI